MISGLLAGWFIANYDCITDLVLQGNPPQQPVALALGNVCVQSKLNCVMKFPLSLYYCCVYTAGSYATQADEAVVYKDTGCQSESTEQNLFLLCNV